MCQVTTPVITRWGSHLKQYKKILTLQPQIVSVVTNPDASAYVSEELREVIFSWSFWESLRLLVEVLTPLCKAVAAVEADSNVSNVMKIWLQLESIFSKKLSRWINSTRN